MLESCGTCFILEGENEKIKNRELFGGQLQKLKHRNTTYFTIKVLHRTDHEGPEGE
jgi:hypothetical protein